MSNTTEYDEILELNEPEFQTSEAAGSGKKRACRPDYKHARILFREAKLGMALKTLDACGAGSLQTTNCADSSCHPRPSLGSDGRMTDFAQRHMQLRAELLIALGRPATALGELVDLNKHSLPNFTAYERKRHFLCGAQISLAMDRVKDASEYIRRAQKELCKEDLCMEARISLIKGRIHLKMGELSRSFSCLVAALGQWTDPELTVEIRLSLVDNFLLAGEYTEAFTQLLHAGKAALQSESTLLFHEVALQHVMALLHCGQLREARPAIRKLHEKLKQTDLPMHKGKVRALMALLALENFKMAEAQLHMQNAHNSLQLIEAKSARRFIQFCDFITCDALGELHDDHSGLDVHLQRLENIWRESGRNDNLINGLFSAMYVLRASQTKSVAEGSASLRQRICSWLHVNLPYDLRPWLLKLECGHFVSYVSSLVRAKEAGPLARFAFPIEPAGHDPVADMHLRLLHSRMENVALQGELHFQKNRVAMQRAEWTSQEQINTSDSTTSAAVNDGEGKYAGNLRHALAERLRTTYPELTSAEIATCIDVFHNRSTKEIAEKYYVAVRTVEKHRYNIRRKMHLTRFDSLAQLLRQL